MVEFVSPDCAICRQMIPTVALIERDCGGRQVEVVKVDVSLKSNQRTAAQFGIRSIPTVILFKGGCEVARQSGAMNAATLVRWVQSAG